MRQAFCSNRFGQDCLPTMPHLRGLNFGVSLPEKNCTKAVAELGLGLWGVVTKSIAGVRCLRRRPEWLH